ncbi:hypothetical protein [Geobacillus thermodenitrificans]|uniref:hypothetical protein n=1 Tax=Geobacillus thermodenitrificans TaxID=33940 RepID=UPI0024C53F55|nr:hypothetical protein PK52_gp61 [Geobacillus phage vB_GthS_PK5.2]
MYFGLTKQKVIEKLQGKGLNDESIQAIAEIIEENNKLIRKEVNRAVSQDIVRQLKKGGTRL